MCGLGSRVSVVGDVGYPPVDPSRGCGSYIGYILGNLGTI